VLALPLLAGRVVSKVSYVRVLANTIFVLMDCAKMDLGNEDVASQMYVESSTDTVCHALAFGISLFFVGA
jgi:hypothetical protein